MKILVINNDGGGFADYVDVADGTTVAQLFERQIGSTKPSHYLIRVNRQPCPADQVLREGDRISITPTKIEGRDFVTTYRLLAAGPQRPAARRAVFILE